MHHSSQASKSSQRLKWSNKLVLCRLRGFPPWPSLVIKPEPRSKLQGPMNPLAPPTDAVFDREVKCVRRGAGFKKGSTVSAHYWVDLHCPCSEKFKSNGREKAGVRWLAHKCTNKRSNEVHHSVTCCAVWQSSKGRTRVPRPRAKLTIFWICAGGVWTMGCGRRDEDDGVRTMGCGQ